MLKLTLISFVQRVDQRDLCIKEDNQNCESVNVCITLKLQLGFL